MRRLLYLLIVPALLQANSLAPPCVAGSLLSYEQSLPGGQCSIGVLNFSDFTFRQTGIGPLDTAAQIELTPAVNGFGFTQVSGNPFTVAAGDNADYLIFYNFVIDPAPVVEGADLALDPPFGDVNVQQGYCNDSSFTIGEGVPVCIDSAGNLSTPQTLTVTTESPKASKIFNPPALNFGSVRTEIKLDGTSGPAGFDGVTGDATVVDTSSTPEPASVILALGGLLAIGLRRKLQPRP
jgi:hypothetical protein